MSPKYSIKYNNPNPKLKTMKRLMKSSMTKLISEAILGHTKNIGKAENQCLETGET